MANPNGTGGADPMGEVLLAMMQQNAEMMRQSTEMTRQLQATIAVQHTEQQDELRELRGTHQAGMENLDTRVNSHHQEQSNDLQDMQQTLHRQGDDQRNGLDLLNSKVDTITIVQVRSATETRENLVGVRDELGQLREGLNDVRNEVGGLRAEQESVKGILSDSRNRNEPPADNREVETVLCARCNHRVGMEFWPEHYRHCLQVESRGDIDSFLWNMTCPRCQHLVEAKLFEEHMQTCRRPGQTGASGCRTCRVCYVMIEESSFRKHSDECAARNLVRGLNSEIEGYGKGTGTVRFEALQSFTSELTQLVLKNNDAVYQNQQQALAKSEPSTLFNALRQGRESKTAINSNMPGPSGEATRVDQSDRESRNEGTTSREMGKPGNSKVEHGGDTGNIRTPHADEAEAQDPGQSRTGNSEETFGAGGELLNEFLPWYTRFLGASMPLDRAQFVQMISIMRSQPFNLAECVDTTSEMSTSEDEDEIPGDGQAETDGSDLPEDEVMELMAHKHRRQTLRLDIRAGIYRRIIRTHFHPLSLAINAIHVVDLLRKEQTITPRIAEQITCAGTPILRAELLLTDCQQAGRDDVLCQIVEDHMRNDIGCFAVRTVGNRRVQRAVSRTFRECRGTHCNGNDLHGLPMITLASRVTASAASAAAQPSEGSDQDVLPANDTAAVVDSGVVHIVQDQNVSCTQEAPQGQSPAADCVHRPLAALDQEQLECAGGIDPDSQTDPTHRPQQPSQAVTDDATPAIDAVTAGPPVISSDGGDGDAIDLPAIHVISKSPAPTTADDTAVGADWGRDVINDVIGEAGAVSPGPAQPAAVASSKVITEHHSVTPILAADSAGDIPAQAGSVVSPTSQSASKAEGLATAQMIPSISAPALGASKKSQDSDDEDLIGLSLPHHGFPLLLDEDMAGEQYSPAAVQATPANSHADPLLASIMSDEEEDEDTSASLTQDAYTMTQLSLQGEHVVAGEEPAVAFSPLLESPSLISVAGTSNGSAGVFLGSDSASAGVATAASDCDVTAGNSGDSLPVTTSRCFRR